MYKRQELHPFKGHPFKVKDDEAMMETADSIKQYGVLVPAIARPDPEGCLLYTSPDVGEFVSHNRLNRQREKMDSGCRFFVLEECE